MTNIEATCCVEFESAEPMKSPFTRLIVVDWYDGVVNGVALCERCNTSWLLDLRAWDGSSHSYTYIAAELPPNFFWELDGVLSQSGSHRESPITIVPVQATDEVENWIKQFTVTDASRQFVVSAIDIAHEITMVRQVAPQDRIRGAIQLTDFATTANLDPDERLKWTEGVS